MINEQIPESRVDVFHNNEIKKVSLEDYKGKWVVLFFYPADFTFVCPTELEDMAKHYDDFVKEGAEVFSVSTDTAFAHKAWHDTSETIGKITFPMIADPSGKLCATFGTLNEDEGLSYRATIIINPEGLIKVYEIQDNGIGRNASEILRKVQSAKFVHENGDQVCPANWKPGGKTLKPGLDLVGKI